MIQYELDYLGLIKFLHVEMPYCTIVIIVHFSLSVLHLGNVYFNVKQLKHSQEGVEIGSQKEVKWAAHLLQTDTEGIIRALTTKSTVRREGS